MKNSNVNLNSIYIKAEVLNPLIKALQESKNPDAKIALKFFEEARQKEAEKYAQREAARIAKKIAKKEADLQRQMAELEALKNGTA